MRSPCDPAGWPEGDLNSAGCNEYAAESSRVTPNACIRRLVCETELSCPLRPSPSSAVHCVAVATDLFLAAHGLDSSALVAAVPPACRTSPAVSEPLADRAPAVTVGDRLIE